MKGGHKATQRKRLTARDRAQWAAMHPPAPWQGTAFDTETFEGWARMICTPDQWFMVPKRGWYQAFNFLIDNGPTLCAWNLRFDVEAILKHLPVDAIRRFLAVEHLNVGPFELDLIPWKMLRIRRDDEVVECYDVAQFFGCSLDQAAKRFLGEGKNHTRQGIDAARLNTDGSAWNRLGPIVRYCQRDAHLTARLANEVSSRFNALGGSFHKPYSVAFVAADMLMRDVEVPRLAQQMHGPSEEAFYGARFECIKRGRFPEAYASDIKSAYPSFLVRIEDAPKGRWVEGTRPHKDALHAIVQCRADIDPDDYPVLAPIPYRAKKSGPVIYPTGTFDTTVLLETYNRFMDVLQPVHSWSYVPQGAVFKPYQKTTQRLVDFRENTDVLLNACAKCGASSIYGKLLNQRMEKRLREIEGNVDHFSSQVLIVDGQPHQIERIRKKGLLYHPLHAGLTTEGCRLKIWDAAMKDPESVIMVQADGILSTRPLHDVEEATKLGQLGYVAEGDTVSCGSGLYQIKGYTNRTRGVRFGTEIRGKGPRSWFMALRGKRTETVQIIVNRPAHLTECLSGSTVVRVGDEVRTLGLKDANVFLPFERNLNVCRDDKRRWPVVGEARRLLKEQFESVPIHMEE